MKLANYIISFFLICTFTGSLLGQVNDIDSLETSVDLQGENGFVETDSLVNLGFEELNLDTFPQNKPRNTDSLGIKPGRAVVEKVQFSKDSLDAPIKYGAVDTQWYDHKMRTMHLYGDAYVEYENMTLKAGYIIFDMENNIASAFSRKDEAGHEAEFPIFNDGEREFTYDQLRYNFKKKKGIVYDAITNESGLYVHGARTKYVSSGTDSIQTQDIVYNKDALITSCNHPEPHYGIRSNKMKVVTKKVAVVGPSKLELAGVPTPLWLPFGFFPLTQGESSGFLFPEDYKYTATRGFGVTGIGWYFTLNEYMNLIVRGNYYANGSHGLNLTSNYKKRYKYSGSMTLRYNTEYLENNEAFLIPDRSFAVGITHNQDSKAHPYRKIGGSVNFQVNGFSAKAYDDAASVLNNTYRSNFTFSHSLPRSPFTFAASFVHSQNTQNQVINVTLPAIDLRMNTIYPFKRKKSSGTNEKWYEKINLKYNSAFKNLITTTDSTIFTNQVFNDMRSGISNQLSSGASFRFLKYFNFSPSVDYNENWYFQKLTKTVEIDTSNEYLVTSNYENDLIAFRDFGASASINTQLFASLPATKGWFRGYRHTIKPRASFSYGPDTRSKYEIELQTGIGELDQERYSPFERAAVSGASLQDLQASLNFNIGGVVEMKYFSKKDSTEKKIKLLDNLTANGLYNFAADSLGYSKISLKGTSRIFKGISTFTFGFGFDPYEENSSNQRIPQLVSKRDQLSPVRMDDGFLKLTTRFRANQIIDLIKNKKTEEPEEVKEETDLEKAERKQKERLNGGKKEDISLANWVEALSFEHVIQYNFITKNGVKDQFFQTNNISMRGSIPLTENWDLNIGNIGYNFTSRALTYPNFTLNRKLHCWNMRITWAPTRGSYGFFIGVTNGNLNFLKYNYGKPNFDGLGRR